MFFFASVTAVPFATSGLGWSPPLVYPPVPPPHPSQRPSRLTDQVVTIPPAPGFSLPLMPWPAAGCPVLPGAPGVCAPAVVIAGAKKCGTNTVNEVLRMHPYARFAGQASAGKRLVRRAGGHPFGENWFLECELYGPAAWPARAYGCTGDTSTATHLNTSVHTT